MSAKPSSLADELDVEPADFQRLKDIVLDAQTRLGEHEPDTFELYALGGILHDLYHGMESMCHRIVIGIDQREMGGANWHHELVELVSKPIQYKRPAVIQETTAALLQDYRGFRHIFRKNYGFDLDWAKMKPLFDHAIPMIAAFTADIEQFITFLRMITASDDLQP